jgi:hypothetical protein
MKHETPLTRKKICSLEASKLTNAQRPWYLECKKDIIGDWGRGSKLHQKLGAKQQKH